MDKFSIILPAAGQSARFGGSRGKLLELLAGEAVLRHSARAFLQRCDVASIVIPAPSDDFSILAGALGDDARDPRLRFCRGGDCRAQSVRNGLQAAPPEIGWIAIHDAARPLVSQELIDRTFAAAVAHGAAVPAMPVSLTIKQATGPLPAKVQRTIPREGLWAMQTPQAMRRADLMAAFESCTLPLAQMTDDAQVMELSGGEIWLVEGDEQNLKITTRTDLGIAELIMADRSAPAKP
jgi:2-C-methyl-D-erythritol 4-phosphate cytidylyltransferase